MNTGTVRILLVEDERHLAEGLLYNLSAEGYEAVLARDGQEALQLFGQGPWNLVVLDLMLPLVDGFEVAQEIRTKEPRVPILMLKKPGIEFNAGLMKGLHNLLRLRRASLCFERCEVTELPEPSSLIADWIRCPPN